ASAEMIGVSPFSPRLNLGGSYVPPPWARPFLSDFAAATARYHLPPGLLARQAQEESNFDPTAVSPAGAIGIMQFMPATAAQFGINPRNPHESIDAAGKYLRQLYDTFQSWPKALAAYNWGPGNLSLYGMSRAPATTLAYVRAITSSVGLA
ncbi:MAG: transglycosylase SLT domain-containing protein, partial [Vulcanimicrobiaceae bacterium]